MALDPNILVVATSARNEFEGRSLVAALEAEGITATVFGQAAATLQWEAGYTDPYKVMVRREDEAAARQIIAELRADKSSVEWADVDVTQPAEGLSSGLVCWACGHKLGGLPASTRTCPGCNAEVFPDEDDARDQPAATNDPSTYADRTKAFRRTGLALVFLPFVGSIGGGIVLGIYEYPRLGIFLVAFGAVVVIRKLFRRS
ncbi:MAG: hypothetical protein NTV94_09330 [Planctomycetota bacterium]|nr:hypothetical protein [Planctomycetota bacterium]